MSIFSALSSPPINLVLPFQPNSECRGCAWVKHYNSSRKWPFLRNFRGAVRRRRLMSGQVLQGTGTNRHPPHTCKHARAFSVPCPFCSLPLLSLCTSFLYMHTSYRDVREWEESLCWYFDFRLNLRECPRSLPLLYLVWCNPKPRNGCRFKSHTQNWVHLFLLT